MDPILRHRYVAALFFAGVFFTVGTAIVLSRSGVSPSRYNAFDINGVIQSIDPAAKIPQTPQPTRPTAVDVPYTKITTQEKTSAKDTVAQSDYFSWDAFVTAMTHPQNTPSASTPTTDQYAFVPPSLIGLDEQQPLEQLTEEQKALYGWGSDAGSAIQSYENSHTDQVSILTNFIQDRESAIKIDAMKKLGADLQAVGNSIDAIGTPAQMSTAAPGLANAYREIGRNLAIIPDSKGDEALVEAILTYNKSAEAFVEKFVNVVLIFQANDVKFSQNEPGSVFMFPGN